MSNPTRTGSTIGSEIVLSPFLDAVHVERWHASMAGREEEGYGIGPAEALADLLREVTNAVSRAAAAPKPTRRRGRKKARTA